MKVLTTVFANKYVYIPLLLWLFVQIIKVIIDLIKEKKLNFKRLVGAGGMPSSHSALVCCLTILIGKYEGFSSSIFALSLIFSLIVMYDACGIRRAAGKQARILNKIILTPNLTGIQIQEQLVELLGHTPVQVIVGAILGIIVGSIF